MLDVPWTILAQALTVILLVLGAYGGQKYRLMKKFIDELDDAIQDDKITAEEAKTLARIIRKIFR